MRDPDEGWTASEANQLRVLLGCKPEAFARRLKIHKRTVIRWRDGETDPAVGLWEDLDTLLTEAARKLAPQLPLDQLAKMNRRDILKLLVACGEVPMGGLDLWNGVLTQVSNPCLKSLEEITTVLASIYRRIPAHLLLGPVMGHLEKASALLGSPMKPTQRRRLESTVADVGVFVAVLSMHTGKLGQARAHLDMAEKMAQQADNMALLAQVCAQQGLLDYYAQAPSGEPHNPKERVTLLEKADQLATRHAPAIVRVAIGSWLADGKAAAKEPYDADEAMERSAGALTQAQSEGLAGSGFCSAVGAYEGWEEGRVAGFRGSVELALGRKSAIDTIRTSLELKTNARWRATGLVDLAKALIILKQPDEACDCLAQAHILGRREGSAAILHHILGARMVMPPKWNSLRCVRQLDDRLQAGWATTAHSNP